MLTGLVHVPSSTLGWSGGGIEADEVSIIVSAWQRWGISFALALLETLGLVWVLYSGRLTVVLLQADGFPLCGFEPNTGLLLVLWVAGLLFAALSFVAAIRGRVMAAVGCFGAEAVAGGAWIGLDGFTAYGCLHG
jgi:hypothetical protein